ncbi:MAG: aminopeptidase P family protein, partial [Desulfamplus sp.]|nr:aminopeptidase P family protein [Desulfamplus sp.]
NGNRFFRIFLPNYISVKFFYYFTGFKIIQHYIFFSLYFLCCYLSDHARIFSIGTLNDEFLKAHEAMLTVQQVAVEAGRAGVVTGELYELMVNKAASLGYEEYFMGTGDRKIRFTGHGLGLELDEFPFIAKGQTLVLQEGMALALEPKAIMPGKGVVGIENTFVVTDKGLKSLAHYPENIIVL